MKYYKKLVSLCLALAIIVSIASTRPITAFAEDNSFTITRGRIGWRFQTENSFNVSGSTDSSNPFDTTLFQTKSNINVGTSAADRYFLLANNYSTETVKPSTAYKVDFNMVVSNNNLSTVVVDFAFGSAMWTAPLTDNGTAAPVQTRFSGNNLTTALTLVGHTDPETPEGAVFGTDKSYDVYSGSVTVASPSSLADGSHLAMSACNTGANISTVYIYNITVTELTDKTVSVTDDNGNSLGNIVCKVGDDVNSLIAGSAYDKSGYTFTVSPAIISSDTTEITVVYTKLPGDAWESFKVEHDSTNWRFYTASHIEKLSSTKFHTKTSVNSSSAPGDRAILLANGYGDSQVVSPDIVYQVDFKLSTNASDFSTAVVDIGFGQYLWGVGCGNDWPSRVRFIGNEVAEHATLTDKSDGDRTVYDMSFTIDAPAGFDYNNPHLLLSVCRNVNLTGSFENWVWDITVTKIGKINTYVVKDGENNELGTIRGKTGENAYSLVESSEYNDKNCTFTVSPEILGADTAEIVIIYTKKTIYTVRDAETGEKLGGIAGLINDDCNELIANSRFNLYGFGFEVFPEFIGENTEEILITYTEIPVQKIDFGPSYRGNPASPHYHTWAQLSEESLLEIKYDEVNDNYYIHTKTWSNGGVRMTDKTQINNRALVLANDYSNPNLIGGKTYELTFVVTIDTHYWSLSQLKAQIRFGGNVWSLVESGAIDYDAGELERYVVNTEKNGTVVDYTISLCLTAPQSKTNVVLSLYGGVEYTLDNVEIWNMFEIPVENQNGDLLGNVFGRIGNKVATVAESLLVEEGDYIYYPATETVQSITSPIVLNKILKQNIVERVDFGPTYHSTDWKYIDVNADSAALEIIDGRVHSRIVSGNVKAVSSVDYNNRAILIKDGDFGTAGLVPGETYRMKFDIEIDTEKADLSNLKADIMCGAHLWNLINGRNTLYDTGTLKDHILGQTKSGNMVTYTIGLNFTVPSDSLDSGAIINAMLSVYTDNAYNVEYWLDNVYIVKKTSAVVNHPRDTSISATAYGYEGDKVGMAYSNNGLAKFVNVNDAVYGWKATPVKTKSFDVIYRGDVNGDFAINTIDLVELESLLLGKSGTYDVFGANANADDVSDETIDICDTISLKKKLTNMILPPSFLKYEDYALVWNAEFDGNRIPNEFDSQWSSDRKDDVTYVGAGDKKTTKVENGILTYGSVYEDGEIITPDHITTKTTMNFTYGYFEIRAKLPFISANLPAFWFKSDGALYKTGTGVQEIDLLETLGSNTSVYTNVHYWNGSAHYSCNSVGGRSFNVANLGVNEFHNYGMEWYRENNVSYIDFYVDGNYIVTIDSSMLSGKTPDLCNPIYFLIDNGAVSASIHKTFTSTTVATSSDFPQSIEVDYVRLYQSHTNEGTKLVVN